MLLFVVFFFERNNSKSKGAPPPPPSQTQMTQVKLSGSAAVALLTFVNTDKNDFIQIMNMLFCFVFFTFWNHSKVSLQPHNCLHGKYKDFHRSILAGLKHNQLY